MGSPVGLFICSITFAIFAVLFFAVGIFGPTVIRNKEKSGIAQIVVIDSFTSPSYWTWQNNTQDDAPPQWNNFYLWNVTNVDEILNGSKPSIQQIGPYSYRKYTVQFNVSFPDGGNQRSSREWQYYKFDAENSFDGADPVNDNITVINAPFQAVLFNLLNGSETDRWWKALAFDFVASYSDDSLFVTAEVEKIIFNFEYPILKTLSSFDPSLSPDFGLQANQTSEDEVFNTTGLSVQKTGKDSLKELGQYVQWNGTSAVDCWGSPEANKIVGTDGTVFAPSTVETDKPYAFVSTLFRSVQLHSNSSTTYKNIDLGRFQLPTNAFLNASQFPDNAVYYQFGPMGVLNMTKCLKAPVFVSMPHFFQADPWYRSSFIGMDPNASLHDTFIDIEPETGLVMHAAKRLQINVKLQEDLLLYPHILKDLYFPLAWIEETGGVTDELAKKFRDSVYFAETLEMIVLWSCFGVGGVFLLVFVIVFVIAYRIRIKQRISYTPVPLNYDDNPFDED